MNRIDLNLLTALDALLSESSVSRAAQRVGVGQPAMSAALARLRTLFKDDILVRGPSGMEPTARARDLAPGLRAALRELRQLVEPLERFDPAKSRRTFRISGGDYVGMTILPRLMTKLRQTAPMIDVRFRFIEKDRIQPCLEAGEVDVAMYVADKFPSHFATATLFEESFVCGIRVGHPWTYAAPTLAAYAKADHLLVTERGDEIGFVDRLLAQNGLTRRVAITVPTIALVADLLAGTDLVATIGARAAERMVRHGLIVAIPPPVVMPAWQMSLVWLARNTGDPALNWFRDRLLESASA